MKNLVADKVDDKMIEKMIAKMKEKQMDTYMVSYRYEVHMSELIFGARFIIGFCGESYQSNCYAFLFEKKPLTSDPNRMRIEKVVMSANKITDNMKDTTIRVFRLLSDVDGETKDGKQNFVNEALVNFLQQFAQTENENKKKIKKKRFFKYH